MMLARNWSGQNLSNRTVCYGLVLDVKNLNLSKYFPFTSYIMCTYVMYTSVMLYLHYTIMYTSVMLYLHYTIIVLLKT